MMKQNHSSSLIFTFLQQTDYLCNRHTLYLCFTCLSSLKLISFCLDIRVCPLLTKQGQNYRKAQSFYSFKGLSAKAKEKNILRKTEDVTCVHLQLKKLLHFCSGANQHPHMFHMV